MRWLSRFIDDVHVLDLAPGAERQVDRLPDGRTALVVRVFAPGHGDVWVFGPRTRAHLKAARGFTRSVIIKFKPGWLAPLLGVTAEALTDQFVPLQAIWGRPCHELCDDLIASESVGMLLDVLSRAFETRMHDESASAYLARRAIRMFEAEAVRVDSVAKQLGVSSRHLRRAFVETVGVTPKDFVRGVRLQRAIQRTATDDDWGRIAHDVGYYDQSHLIADFRDLVGLTPRAYAARLRGQAEGPRKLRMFAGPPIITRTPALIESNA